MRALRFGARANKYGAQKTADGFPSKLERAVYYKLLEREKLGLIKDIKRQQTIVLQDGPRDQKISWRVDFSFTNCETGELNLCEAKGFPTDEYKLKLKLFRANPMARMEIWIGHAANPKLSEIIEPKSESQIRKDKT